MATRAPLTVTLSTPDRSGAFENVRDVQFSRTWRGGFKDATVTLSAPLDYRDPLLTPFAKMRIDDDRTGRTVWEGYVDLPGKSRSDEGDVWQIGAVGPTARLGDRQKSYIVIDTQLGSWEQAFATNSGMSVQTGGVPGDEDTEALVFQFPQGIPVATDSRVTAIYDAIEQTGQLVGGYEITHKEGFTAASDWRVQVVANLEGTPQEITTTHLYDTSPNSNHQSAGGALMGTDRNVLRTRMIRASGAATNINNDNNWSAVTSMRVSAMRRLANGTLLTGAGTYANNYVLAHEVVTDALYWFCGVESGGDWFSSIDLADASIDTSFTYQIDQLAYPDPTTFQQLLDDLALLEPDMLWDVLESNAQGQHRFNVRRLSDDVRYMATAEDGWDAPGGEADLRNSVTVTWLDGAGRQKSKSYTTDVAELDQWFIIRDAELVDLGTELGSMANADRIGDRLLEQASMPPEAGTLTVARPIMDMWAGREVQPWEIEAGYRVLITDVDIDPLPITDVDYRDNDASAALTLSEPVYTTDQLVNLFARRRSHRT